MSMSVYPICERCGHLRAAHLNYVGRCLECANCKAPIPSGSNLNTRRK